MRRAAAWLSAAVALAALVVAATACLAEESPAAATVGWRGNWTGVFPDAHPPTEWSRVAKGVVAGMTCQAARPAEGAAGAGRPLDAGLPRDWLIVGPMPVGDSVKDFGAAALAGEADLAPAEGDKAGEAAWQRLEVVKKPDYERWGTTELDWVDLGEVFGTRINQMAYAHTYLYCERPGRVVGVVDHGYGLKVWLNGEAVYAAPKREGALGSYVGISRQKQALTNTPSPRFEMTLRKGWNRLLARVSTANVKGYREMRFAPRFYDPEPVPYEEKNIVWVARLPERSNAPPIVVGDRLFVTAEPDELLCLDKRTGKTLWRRLNGAYEATPEAYRAAHPVFKEKIDPLAEELYRTTDYDKGLALRRQIEELLVGADEAKYKMRWDGHLAAHFGIVGFTTTAVSDGRRVYVFYGHGVAACYDLEGKRQWITRLEAPEIRYSCSPALAGGRLITVFGGMQALDADTGAVVWRQPEVSCIASLIPGRVAGTDVVSTRDGRIVRAADGKVLWSNPHIRTGDTGWAAPAFVGNMLYVPWNGLTVLIVADFAGVSGDAWEPKVRLIELQTDNHRPNGEWLDRNTACSPVVFEGLHYNVDQYGVFYAVDLASGKTLYRQDLGFDEMHHYNAIGVGASPTLGGKHLYTIDNQGTCVVLEPGPAYKRVAVNRIETVLQRQWPLPTQEILSNAAPVCDGDRLYLRGEQYLYCIGRHDGPAARPGDAGP